MEANNTLAMRKRVIKNKKSSIECHLVLKTLFLHRFPNINKTLKISRFGAFEKCRFFFLMKIYIPPKSIRSQA
jgi:hypothetical protein